MAEREFFDDDNWGNRSVSFSFPQSHWTLVKKLSDHNTQLTPYYALEYPDKRGAAYGTFLARNVDKTDEEAIIRIILQYAPHIGHVGGTNGPSTDVLSIQDSFCGS